jgi:acyl-CoA reductase-like NAD-dependent aldehyde dehydrogenase
MNELSRVALAEGETSNAEARRIFEVQHAASRREPLADVALRRDRLGRLGAMVSAHAEAFADAISADFGTRSRTETKLLEIVPSLGAVRFARKKVARWMKPERRRVDPTFQPASAWVRYEPLGVIGIISPWNYPLQLAVSPLVDALAAGNRAMIKPSELTPSFAALLKRAIAERFDEAEVAVVTGGVEAGQHFATLPFDHLLFTGSTAIGRKVYQAAAANLTPVTLELGGKSPAIVCPDYPLAKAARSISFGKFLNSGQTCIAPDYVLVDRAVHDDFLAEVVRATEEWRLGDPFDDATLVGPMNNEPTAQKMDRHLEDALEKGAEVVVGGRRDPDRPTGLYYQPTVVDNVGTDTLINRDETFGPIVPLITVSSDDQALEVANDSYLGLQAAVYTSSLKRAFRYLDHLRVGNVVVNDSTDYWEAHEPFGGASGTRTGWGRIGGRYTMLDMTDLKTVVLDVGGLD